MATMTPHHERKPLGTRLLRLALGMALVVGVAVGAGRLAPPSGAGETTHAERPPPSPSPSEHAARRAPNTRWRWAYGVWALPTAITDVLDGRLRPIPASAGLITIPYVPGVLGEDSDRFTYGGVNYDDPTAGGVPLQWVDGGEDTWLTPGFTLRDFAPRDGAAFARIDPALVAALERLRIEADTVSIVSGYRHPQHNVAVGGTGRSFHTAGKAADVWSPSHSPLDLARLALRAMGCDIGIGLGPHTLHLDIRGELATWTYPGAPLHEAAFDAWALTQCGRPVPPALALAAASTWLSDSTSLANPATPLNPISSLAPDVLVERYARTIAEVARQGRLTEGAGGVIVDATTQPEPTIRYLRASSPEAVSLGLVPLISWCTARGSDAYVAYLVLNREGATTGITNVAPLRGPARAVAPAEALDATGSGLAPPPRPAPPTSAALPADPERESWTVVVASLVSQDAAHGRAVALREQVQHVGPISVVAAPSLGRYRVTVGPYRSAAEARQALAELDDAISTDAWILAL